MLTSHAFRPRISIRSRNATVDSAFVCPLYRGRVAFNYRVLHIAALCAFAAFFQRRFHSISAHLAMHVVDLHLYWWPPSLCHRGGVVPARRRFSAWCCNSSRISYYFIIYIEVITAKDLARIYIKEVFIRYRLLEKIVLD